MHWKYIKREKKNGRWVYYYDENSADNYDFRNEQNRQNAEKKRLSSDWDVINAKKDSLKQEFPPTRKRLLAKIKSKPIEITREL